MSAAQILKSMKAAPKLEKSTYNRWSKHFRDALSLFDVESYILEIKDELKSRDSRSASEEDKLIHKQDKNIRVAISQLVPDIAFHLVDCSFTSKHCWDNLKDFYCPNSAEDMNDLLQEFWGLTFEDDINIDEFVQKLAEIRGKISLIDTRLTPSDSAMKKRLLGHFIKCCGGFYMSTIICLKDPAVDFQTCVTSIRASHEVYDELHPVAIAALASKSQVFEKPNSSSTNDIKKCAFCKRKGHLREACFHWLVSELEWIDYSKPNRAGGDKIGRTRRQETKRIRARGCDGRRSRANRDKEYLIN